jgi:hypothetical protein
MDASEKVFLIFDPGLNFVAFGIRSKEDYANIHDLSLQWTGFWVYARANTWLSFDLDPSWTGFTT